MGKRRMRIHSRVIVGGDPVTPGKEYNPGDEEDFEEHTAKGLEEQGVASEAGKKGDPKPVLSDRSLGQ